MDIFGSSQPRAFLSEGFSTARDGARRRRLRLSWHAFVTAWDRWDQNRQKTTGLMLNSTRRRAPSRAARLKLPANRWKCRDGRHFRMPLLQRQAICMELGYTGTHASLTAFLDVEKRTHATVASCDSPLCGQPVPGEGCNIFDANTRDLRKVWFCSVADEVRRTMTPRNQALTKTSLLLARHLLSRTTVN